MGGRKSYSVRRLIGSSDQAKKSFTTLRSSIEKAEVKEIGKSAFELFYQSKKTIDYSAYSIKLAPAIIKNYSQWKSEKDDNKVRREIGKAWSEVKTKNEISVPKEVDRIIVENAFKSLRGGGK